VGQGRVFLDTCDDIVSEVGVVACKLMCKGWKDVFEFSSVEVIPGAEEAGTEGSISSNHF
jgi:hypothetical protein